MKVKVMMDMIMKGCRSLDVTIVIVETCKGQDRSVANSCNFSPACTREEPFTTHNSQQCVFWCAITATRVYS